MGMNNILRPKTHFICRLICSIWDLGR